MTKSALLRLSTAVVLVAGLSACASPMVTPDAQRAAGGALAGAAVAKLIHEDVKTGALLGAAAGALCDDARVCQSGYGPY
ncbi:hypothetical protein ACEUZ9_000962 [Paracoccus litorisediminis]|uniref:hypothetical protein n=1 Tax=Paracoccus litorisediminis TaxID=2006130 RepID=UPI00372FFDC9